MMEDAVLHLRLTRMTVGIVMIIGRLLAVLVKSLGTLLLALAVLWPTAQVAGTEDSEVVVHVMERQVRILIDDQVFWIADENVAPIVWAVRPRCEHVMRVFRGEELIQEVEFFLQPGEQGVLTAWDPARAHSAGPRRERIAVEILVLGRRRPAETLD